MTGNVFLYRMPAGIPGALSRAGQATVEPVVIWPEGTTGEFVEFGLAGVIDATTGEFRVVKSTDATIYGFLVRPYPTGGVPSLSQGQGDGAPADGVNNVLVRGYLTVLLYGATAAVKGGAVYVRVGGAGAGEIIGGVEAADDGADCILVSNAYFMGPADADGNIEIAFNV